MSYLVEFKGDNTYSVKLHDPSDTGDLAYQRGYQAAKEEMQEQQSKLQKMETQKGWQQLENEISPEMKTYLLQIKRERGWGEMQLLLHYIKVGWEAKTKGLTEQQVIAEYKARQAAAFGGGGGSIP